MFLAIDSSLGIVGIVELSIRGDIAGVEGQQVRYVEGLFVTPELSHRGIASRLLKESQDWARATDRADRVIIDKTH
jgi:GNAT superfamily N-acetyltransferase